MKNLVLKTLLVSIALSGLSACAPFIMGGAFVGGVMVASDRRTSGAQLEDEGIEFKAAARLREVMGDRAHINVTSYNRQVLLTGEVPSEADKTNAKELVAKVENVKSIENDLAVLGNSSLSARSSDTVVTGRVKAALVDEKEVSANAFKVVTERGAVYLMGRVTKHEAERATDAVRKTAGVQKVVRLFEYITDEELKALTPAPAPVSDSKPSPVLSGSGQPINSGTR
jgi:osmotically-inducible protein OsmY